MISSAGYFKVCNSRKPFREGYSLEASDMKDSSVVLKLSKDDRLLKEEKT